GPARPRRAHRGRLRTAGRTVRGAPHDPAQRPRRRADHRVRRHRLTAPSDRHASVGAMSEQKRLSEGDPAPDFSLPDSTGKQVSLSDYRGRPVVVYFYPAASTPGCTKQACDFRDNLAELNEAGFAVLGISPDKPGKLAKFVADERLTFPLLSDESR